MNQASLFPDICRAYHGGNSFSEAANVRTTPRKQSDCLRIKQYIGERLGATCEEVEIGLAMLHQTASARIRELRNREEIEISDRRRTSTGSWAAVYRVKR
jgi:hypothetical protein